MEKEEIGKVTHFFGKIQVAAIKLSSVLRVGDKIAIIGAHTDLEQGVDSIQLDKKQIDEAEPGQEVAIKVSDRVRENDLVYKILE